MTKSVTLKNVAAGIVGQVIQQYVDSDTKRIISATFGKANKKYVIVITYDE